MEANVPWILPSSHRDSHMGQEALGPTVRVCVAMEAPTPTTTLSSHSPSARTNFTVVPGSLYLPAVYRSCLKMPTAQILGYETPRWTLETLLSGKEPLGPPGLPEMQQLPREKAGKPIQSRMAQYPCNPE